MAGIYSVHDAHHRRAVCAGRAGRPALLLRDFTTDPMRVRSLRHGGGAYQVARTVVDANNDDYIARQMRSTGSGRTASDVGVLTMARAAGFYDTDTAETPTLTRRAFGLMNVQSSGPISAGQSSELQVRWQSPRFTMTLCGVYTAAASGINAIFHR